MSWESEARDLWVKRNLNNCCCTSIYDRCGADVREQDDLGGTQVIIERNAVVGMNFTHVVRGGTTYSAPEARDDIQVFGKVYPFS